MNFGDDLFATTPQTRSIIAAATARGIGLEVEAFDAGHVIAAISVYDEGVLPGRLRFNLVFGVPGGIDASPAAPNAMLRPLARGRTGR